MLFQTPTALLVGLLPALASATLIPRYDNMHAVWRDDFWGFPGISPNSTAWNIIDAYLGYNEELETYTTSNANLQLSGGGTLQIIPRLTVNGTWTSARIESVDSHTPAPSAITRYESKIRMGNNSAAVEAGIWPAFWMLGEAERQGTSWPLCGELDILEQVNGEALGYGTAHCEDFCEEPTGRQASVVIPSDNDWHTWRLDVDRTAADWQSETITWYLDGQSFFSISGSTISDEATWSVLAHSPYYFILNIAVGGTFGGNPDANTIGGYGSMMEVAYVAVYSS